MPPVTLQLSLAPSDHRLAQHILPHQIRTWRGQVAEILITIDLHRSAGRFADGWTEGRDNILALAHSIEGDVNFSTRAEISALASGESAGRVRR